MKPQKQCVLVNKVIIKLFEENIKEKYNPTKKNIYKGSRAFLTFPHGENE